MKKDFVYENKKMIAIAICSLAIILLAFLCVIGFINIRTNSNDQKVENAVSKITYTEDNAIDELNSLKPFTKYDFLSVNQRGNLYRSMAELSYMTEDDMVYNHYMAYALYYLQEAGETESVIYLYNKYIGRLYANGCYDSAEDIFMTIEKIADTSSLSPDLQSSYFLSRADVTQQRGEDPSSDLNKANTAIKQMPGDGNKLLDMAKYDLLCARNDILHNDFEKAENRISTYSADDNFGLGKNQVYVICDFVIPYYEIMSKIELHKGNSELALNYVDKYIDLCDRYDFRDMKLRLLHYINTNTYDSVFNTTDTYVELEKTITEQNLSEMTDQYGHFLVNDISNTQDNLAIIDSKNSVYKRNAILTVVLLYVVILLYCLLSVASKYVSREGLTRLYTRKKYEQMQSACKRRQIPYCLLLMDIDDFKKVNDTYGHSTGDSVLREISRILLQYSGRGISSYRYGGEELSMFFLHVPEERVRQIAEEIRIRIENTFFSEGFHVTISGGIGVSTNGENVLHIADEKLYEAKRNGKNQIR